MKFNSREMAHAASQPCPDKEGKLGYKKPHKTSGFKDKWFRLKGNLLFYYSWDSLSTSPTFDFSSPQGVIVLERIRVQHEPHHPEQSFVFSLSFEPASEDVSVAAHDYGAVARAKHYFAGRTLEDCEEWVTRFRQASTETLKSHILFLQAKILKTTGVDPLDSLYLNPKVEFRNTQAGGGLKLRHMIDVDPVMVTNTPEPTSGNRIQDGASFLNSNLGPVPTIVIVDGDEENSHATHSEETSPKRREEALLGVGGNGASVRPKTKSPKLEKMPLSLTSKRRPLNVEKSAVYSDSRPNHVQSVSNGAINHEPRAPPRRRARSRGTSFNGALSKKLSFIEEEKLNDASSLEANSADAVDEEKNARRFGENELNKDHNSETSEKLRSNGLEDAHQLHADVILDQRTISSETSLPGDSSPPDSKPHKSTTTSKISAILPPVRHRKKDKVTRTASMPVSSSRFFVDSN